MSALSGRQLLKGHGTQNDFVLLVDPDCEVELSTEDIAAVCDRRAGIGADGFVRVVRTAALPGAEAFAQEVPEAEWFMDYYNADGSVAEMCGNATRLFALVLAEEGLAEINDGDSITIGTRGGARSITRIGDLWTVDMGPAKLVYSFEAEDGEDAPVIDFDSAVRIPGIVGKKGALSITMPNPHTVVALPDESKLESAKFAGLTDSGKPVVYDPVPSAGTNLELVVPLGQETDEETGTVVGLARVRILERGVGETMSCGTGCCAVAVALHLWSGGAAEGAPTDYRLFVPGGEVGVHVGENPLADDASVLLTGPAQIVGRVTLA